MVCDKDCFNCPYPDCILRNEKEYKKQNIGLPAYSKEYQKAYREKNREKLRNNHKRWYEQHREEISAKRKAERGKKHEMYT